MNTAAKTTTYSPLRAGAVAEGEGENAIVRLSYLCPPDGAFAFEIPAVAWAAIVEACPPTVDAPKPESIHVVERPKSVILP